MAMTLSDEAPVEDVERFQKAMKAWMPVAGLLASWGYDYADYEKDGVMPVTCKECEASDFYDGADLEIKHEPGCKLAEAEAGLETLRKMATEQPSVSVDGGEMKPVNPYYYQLFDSYGIRKGTESHEMYEKGKRRLRETEDRWAGQGVLPTGWYAEGVRSLVAWLGI